MVKFLFTLPENKRNEYCKAQEKMDSVKNPQNLSTDTEFPADKNVMNKKSYSKGKKRGELINYCYKRVSQGENNNV